MTSITVASPAVVRPGGRSGRRVAGLAAAAFGLLVVPAGGLALMVGVLVAGAATAVAVWRHPGWAMVAVVALLPVDRFLILLVFHFTGSRQLTLGAQVWKDLVAFVLLAKAIDVLVTSHPRLRLRFLDLLVVAFLALAVLYLFHPGDGVEVSPMNRVLGFRADALFLFAYVAGRVIPLDRRQLRWLLGALVPGTLITAVVAAAQFAWPRAFTDFFDGLSFQEFAGGIGEVEVIRDRGIAGVDLPRASSLLLSDLALAFFAVFAVAVASALFFTARRRGHVLLAGATVAAALVTSVLTVTRSAVLAAVVVVAVSAVAARAVGRGLVLGALCVAGALLALVVNVIPVSDVSALADPDEASVQAHVDAITEGLDTVEEHPLGRGLGTAGTVGQRFVPERALTSENWFLQIATEIGAVGGILFVAITLVAAGVSWSAHCHLRDPLLRRVALALVGGSAGFFLLANVFHAWEVAVMAMSFWMLVGVVASAADREVAPA